MTTLVPIRKILTAATLSLSFGLVASAQAMTYNFSITDPEGNQKAGDISNIITQYDAGSQTLSWKSTISKVKGKRLADGFTLVLSDGPNPRLLVNEYAIFYGDFKTGNLTTYVYDGSDSSKGVWETGEFIKSFKNVINSDYSIKKQITFDFSINVADINNFSSFGNSQGINDWDGAQFNQQVGIWYHPFTTKKDIKYNQDGSIKSFKRGNTSYYDTANKTADVPEPGILALTGLGLIGMIGARRRSNKKI